MLHVQEAIKLPHLSCAYVASAADGCVCAVLQVNGTVMPSGNGAEHLIHEHIAQIRQRNERIVIKFEGAAACAPMFVLATCIKTCVPNRTKTQRHVRVCNGIDNKMHCDMSQHHAVQCQTVRM